MSFFPPTYRRANHRTNRATFSPSSMVASARANSWNVTIKTTAPGQSFGITFAGTSSAPRFVIDWGDGTVETHTTITSKYHTYYLVKTHVIRVQGVFRTSGSIRFNILNPSYIVKTGAIPPIPGMTSLSSVFQSASNLEEVPENFLHFNPQITTAAYAFQYCPNFKTVPSSLFQYNRRITTFQSTFDGCTALKSVPETLFKFSSLAASSGFYTTFYNCTSLAAIPVDLFRYNTLVSTNAFRGCFQGCTSLTTLPTDIFRYNTSAGSDAFRYTFRDCTGITSLPADIFRYNTNVGNNAFYGTFYGCTALTTLPTDLFRYNVAAAGSTGAFYVTFATCSSLATVCDDLFRYNVLAVTNAFQGTFEECPKLQQKANMFFAAGEEGTRFLNQSVSFDGCFYLSSSYTGVTGTAPALWSCTFGTGTPVKTDCWHGHSVSSVDNFASIPADWT